MMNSRFLIFLAAVALILGITTEIVVLYKTTNEGDIAKQEAIIKLEAAKNAERLKAAEAAKMEAEAEAAKEIAKIKIQEAANAARLKAAEAAKVEAEARLNDEKAKTAAEEAANAKKAQAADAEIKRLHAIGAAAAQRDFQKMLDDPAGFAREATREGLADIDRKVGNKR